MLTPFVVPSPVTHMVVAGNILHVAAAQGGYAAYQIPGLTPTAYTLTGSCNAPVTWTLNGPGTLSASGLYTAPASFTSPQTVTVTATSRVDATQTASSTITLSDTLLLTLTTTSPAPFVVGGPATVQALVTNAIGGPAAGASVTFTTTGANPGTATLTTDANGRASYTYTGAARGADTIVAASRGFNSSAFSAFWVNPTNTVTSTAISTRFFNASSGAAFTTQPSEQPAFTQNFPDLMFNGASNTVLDGTGASVGTIARQASAGAAVFRGSFVVKQAGTYTFNVESADGFLFGIAGATRVSGILVNAPATTPFHGYPVVGANNAATTGSPNPIVVNFPAAGSYPYEVDHKIGATLTFGIRPLNPLVITASTPNRVISQTASFSILAKDETGTPVAQLPVTVTVGGAHPQTLLATTDSNGVATVTYSGGNAGADLVQATASINGQLAISNQAAVAWSANQAPQISVSGDALLTLPATAQYTATVIDPVAPNGGTITVAWTKESGPGDVVFEYPTQLVTRAAFSAPGSYVLRITATDLLGSNMLDIPVTVAPPVMTSQGWIGTPADHTQVTGIVPITVAPGVTLTSGTLGYYPLSNPSAVVTLNANTTGTGTIGTIDTTLLNNGTYYVLLNATNSTGQTQGSGIWIVVGGDYKPGRVTTTVTDLVVPAPGLPIQISRTYDSLTRNTSSDFGYGWSLSLKVQMEIANTQDVTLTINGQRRTFYFTPEPGGILSFLYQPRYTPEPGLFGKLEVTGSNCAPAPLVRTGNIYICSVGLAVYQPSTLVYTDPYGRVYTVDGQGNLNSIKDLANNTLTVTSTGITASNGLSVPFVRDAQGRITRITDPLGNQYNYTYDAAGNLATLAYPGVATPVSYTYDATHLYIGGTDPRSNALPGTTYYPNGRLQSVTDAAGKTTSYAYDLATRTTTITNPPDANGQVGTVQMVYDAYGMLLSTKDPLNHTTTNVYDANHNLTSVTDPLGHTTSYTYDSKGNRTSVTNPLNKTSSTVYNAASEPIQITDELGNVRTFTYDANFWPKLSSDAIGPVVSFTFNPNGTMAAKAVGYDLSVTSGKATTYIYDQYGNMTSETDALGRQTTYVYDSMGRKTSMTPPAPTPPTTYTYDALGRLKTVNAPLGRDLPPKFVHFNVRHRPAPIVR